MNRIILPPCTRRFRTAVDTASEKSGSGQPCRPFRPTKLLRCQLMLIRNGLTSHSLLLRDLLSNQTNSSVVSDNLARKCTVYTPEDWRQLFPVIGGKMFRLTPAIKNLSSVPSCVRNFTTWKFSTTPVSKYYPRIVATKPPMAPKVQKPAPQPIVTVKKANLPQSPWKMNFLVKLVSDPTIVLMTPI